MTRAGILAVVALLLPLGAHAQDKRSGYEDASPETRAMQDDDTANPGFLWVQQGEAMWRERVGSAGRSCAECHGAASSLRGVAARYPAYDARLGRPLTLEQRINQCRTERQGAPALVQESDALLAITAFVGLQSRGLPVAVVADGPVRPFFEVGREIYMTRQGQLNLACSQCHDALAGKLLAGSPIPQGQANGYPLYRLEWQGMGSLFRRIRNCMVGVRAEPFAPDAPELVDLELYLAWRANGLNVETPAVRP
ncbi:sulfur oxidation c-type cytochrome SoxA [Limobrevibacterium gyesilva]|uniref:L-cysteine S-thiosulfotransferase subunit SoxA n=1 Tax=Limobrevibacterium gyesilva TaxID=2991712 RepID=A0AA42CDI5_9PROT|nr:sulfur oxidation c-type cytochrome SoxA [Limobrevibacterium gyesilva]MCW3473914.1 sulfur oxidation c-type cytochrome SoxA [Limobrevibacterium gyesilva]